MERAIKPQNNFSRNIAEAKSKLRCEHHRLSHRRIDKSFFSPPAHDWQCNPGQVHPAITIWKSKRRREPLWSLRRNRGRRASGLSGKQASSLLRFLSRRSMAGLSSTLDMRRRAKLQTNEAAVEYVPKFLT